MAMKISDGELKLLEIIWENPGIRSGELVSQAHERLSWKKSTVYTVLKKLEDKGILVNEQSVIRPLATRDEILSQRSGEMLRSGYSGSLPMFLAAFLTKEKLTPKEAEELKRLIDRHTEKGDGE